MKKIVSLLIALMLLTVAMASAEPAITFTDPVLTISMGDDGQTIDLTGLELVCAAGEIDGVPAAQVDINGNGEKLMGLSVNVTDSRVFFAIDGVSRVFYVQLPAAAENLQDFNLDLSDIDIDTDALLAALIGGIEMNGDSTRVSHTAINDALELLLPAIEKIDIPGADLSQAPDLIAQLKETDSGIDLEGSFAQTDSGFAVSGQIIPVSNGEAADAALNIDLTMDDSGISANIEIPGQGSFYLNIQTADDAALVNIGGEASGVKLDLAGAFATGDVDVEFVKLDTADAMDAETVLSSEENEALSGELMEAVGGLISFVTGSMMNAA